MVRGSVWFLQRRSIARLNKSARAFAKRFECISFDNIHHHFCEPRSEAVVEGKEAIH